MRPIPSPHPAHPAPRPDRSGSACRLPWWRAWPSCWPPAPRGYVLLDHHDTGPPSTTSRTTGLPAIHHVFVIVLENEGYDNTFGDPSADPYLATTLPASGALLTDYYGIGHYSNDNYIALISGQAPNPSNQADCQVFADFPPTATVAADGQISDSGCVFPTSVTTVANQLDQAHLTWKGYMEDMGNIPSREPAVCGHPAVGSRT